MNTKEKLLYKIDNDDYKLIYHEYYEEYQVLRDDHSIAMTIDGKISKPDAIQIYKKARNLL